MPKKGYDEEEEGHLSQASSIMADIMQPVTDLEPTCDANLGLILKELQEFRRQPTTKQKNLKDETLISTHLPGF